MSSPAIILRSRYVLSDKKEFKSYVNYINRDDAKINVDIKNNKNVNDFSIFHTYMAYMNDVKKDGQLFDENNDYMDSEQKEKLKDKFKLAQENDSPMWQDVISFDNDFLEECGFYDSKTGDVDESKLKNIARETIRQMASDEEMKENNLAWTGAIHHNTDNIHIHLAIVEPYPTREKITYNNKEQYKGKRKQKTVDKMKRTVAKSLYDRNKDFQKIDELIREPARQKRNFPIQDNNKFQFNFKKAMENLPKDRTQWKYGYHSINNAREYIDEISKDFMETYYPDELKELNKELDKQEIISTKLYGKESRSNEYKDNKLNDLKKRLGNAVLQEMRTYDKEIKQGKSYSEKGNSLSFRNIKRFKETGEIKKQPVFQNKNIQQYSFRNYSTKINFNRFNYAMRKSYHDVQKEKQMAEFDRMQEGMEID